MAHISMETSGRVNTVANNAGAFLSKCFTDTRGNL
jgi:hypothetical protein